ncbi:unnamed protein product [Urochloa humidicola]
MADAMEEQRRGGSGGGWRIHRRRVAGGGDRQVQPRHRPPHQEFPQECAQGHAPTCLTADYFADRIQCPHHHHRHIVQPGAEAKVYFGVLGIRRGGAHLRLRPACHVGMTQCVLVPRAPATPVEGSSNRGGGANWT